MRSLTKRSIVIFPNFQNVEIIDQFRARYDPLAHKIRPHITLVFPFVSSHTDEEVRAEVALRSRTIGPFHLVLSGASEHKKEYVILECLQGSKEIAQLHDQLYSGLLAPFRSATIPYRPHLTIGRLGDPQSFAKVLSEAASISAEFTTVVESVSVERILPDETSAIESEIVLGSH